MNEVFPELYKKDSTGKIRTWCMELKDDQYRTIAGVQDGQLVTSKWTTAKGKNIGKVNETTAEEQALNEIEAQYKKKLAVDYHDTIEDVEVFKTFKPMLATEYNKRKAKLKWGPEWRIQPKLDGIRCIASKHGLFSRTGKEIVAVPHISEELIAFFEKYPDTTLDGELYNHDLKHNFNKIVSLVRKTKPTTEDIAETADAVEYHIYDIVGGGTDAMEFPERSEELATRFENYPMDKLVLVQTNFATSEHDCDLWHDRYLAAGYEGSMVRLPDVYAKGKRSSSLIKRKDFDDAEFKVIGYEEGNGNFVGLPKVILIELPNGSTAKATMTGSRESLAEIKENFSDYEGKVATVQYFGWTPDGQLRFPIVKIIHKERKW